MRPLICSHSTSTCEISSDLSIIWISGKDEQSQVGCVQLMSNRLDVSQHMSLCRHYVRELRRSMLVETPEMDKATSKRSSKLLENFDIGEAETQASSNEKRSTEQRLSAFLRHENGHAHTSNGSVHQSLAHSLTSQVSRNYSRPSGDKPSPSEKPPRASFMDSGDPRTDSNSPGHTVARADIKASAEKILYTFVLPGSEREIVLPESMLSRIIRAIEEEGRDDPEVFEDAKDYVFQAMERDAFPGFLQAKALGNLVPLSVLLRLIIGLASLMAGFWGGFYMILTDKSRQTRCWVRFPLLIYLPPFHLTLTNTPQLILPFALGCYFLLSYQYKLDILAAYLGFSEYTWMNWSRIREPFVRRLLLTRATMALLIAGAFAVGLSVLFIFVPGTKF